MAFHTKSSKPSVCCTRTAHLSVNLLRYARSVPPLGPEVTVLEGTALSLWKGAWLESGACWGLRPCKIPAAWASVPTAWGGPLPLPNLHGSWKGGAVN